MKDHKFTKKEIEAIKKEYLEEHTIIGTDKPVIIEDDIAVSILRSRKYHEDYINSVHKSHKLTEWRTEIMAPVGTARFYNYRECEICGGAQYYHAAGKFIDGELKEECFGE